MSQFTDTTKSRVLLLKSQGNDAFREGCKIVEKEREKELLRSACMLYGQSIEAILEIESQGLDIDNYKENLTEQYALLRPSLFLNLAAANLKLGGADGALKCCNSVVQLCNNPGLKYSELLSADEITDIIHPISSIMISLMTKALYRRGQCFLELFNIKQAYNDFKIAHTLSPDNKDIKNSLHKIELQLNKNDNCNESKNEKNHERLKNENSIQNEKNINMDLFGKNEIEEMTVNGGKCWMRKVRFHYINAYVN
jgi:tetratricopeptide (TPR) repeat protein